ncbi:MAG: glycosyltransferase family 9 protein [Burkholderiales bacterium]
MTVLNTRKGSWIHANIRQSLFALKFALKWVIYLPISPKGFKATVSLLRSLGFLRRPAPGDDGQVHRILVSYPYGNLGDQILTLPMLEALHARWPKAAIDMAVNAKTADLLVRIPFIDRVYRYNIRQSSIRGLTNYLRVFDVVALYRNEVMRQDYDLAITPRWGEDACYGTYLVYLSGAPIRCGYSASVDGNDTAMDRLLTRVADGGGHEQEALRDLRLLSRVCIRNETPEDEAVVFRTIISLQEIAAQETAKLTPESPSLVPTKYIVISAGATSSRRLWPMENLVALLKRLQEREEVTFILIGSMDDALRCEDVARLFPDHAVSLAGKTTLMQLVALIANAALFVGNDSGPAHIAGALGVPTVVVSPFPLSCKDEHPNSTVRFRPCGPRVAIVQPAEPLQPCLQTCEMDEPHCIKQVSVEQVLNAVDALIPSGRASHGALL